MPLKVSIDIDKNGFGVWLIVEMGEVCATISRMNEPTQLNDTYWTIVFKMDYNYICLFGFFVVVVCCSCCSCDSICNEPNTIVV